MEKRSVGNALDFPLRFFHPSFFPFFFLSPPLLSRGEKADKKGDNAVGKEPRGENVERNGERGRG